MSDFETILFPYPHFVDNDRVSGSIMDFPALCKKCEKLSCQSDKNNEIGLCSYGFNYFRVDERIVIAGFVLRQFHANSDARQKRLRHDKDVVIEKVQFEMAVLVLFGIERKIGEAIEKEKERIVREYVEARKYEVDFLEPLREEVQRGLSFVHDYRQINAQIIQNINVIIEKSYSGESIDEKIKKAAKEEVAIYMAAKFLDEKLNVAKFLLHPEWLDIRRECTRFRVHGAVLKYMCIYEPMVKSKNVTVHFPPGSFNEITANPQAFSVIPHTFLDNAAKYSPKGGTIEIDLYDEGHDVVLSVSSYGPRIAPGEETKIFDPFFRGNAAESSSVEGAGYGLYISQMIATRHLGTRIEVQQESRQKGGMGHWTTFSIRIPAKAAILE